MSDHQMTLDEIDALVARLLAFETDDETKDEMTSDTATVAVVSSPATSE